MGPVIGGSLVQLSWRWVFWINLPVGVVAILLAKRVVPESKDESIQGRPDLLGAGLLAVAIGLLALALVEAPSWGWGSAKFSACSSPRSPRVRRWCSGRSVTTRP